MFDAQSDLASVVYGASDEPDRLLLGFSGHLRRAGSRIVGVIQLGRTGPAADLSAVMLPGADVIGVAHDRGDGSHRCRLRAGWVAGIAKRIAAELDRGADLLILNRFGKLEAEGFGFVNLIAQAAEADIPVLTAVAEHRFASWIAYSGGMNVRLPCRRAALDRWWQSVGGGTGARRSAGTFCELAK